MERQKLILISDDVGLRACLSYQLGKHGFEVALFDTSAEAVRSLSHAAVSYVLLDALLEKEDGFEACAALRAALPHARLVMISGRLGKISRLKALGSGADAYVRKPFSFVTLLSNIAPVDQGVAP